MTDDDSLPARFGPVGPEPDFAAIMRYMRERYAPRPPGERAETAPAEAEAEGREAL